MDFSTASFDLIKHDLKNAQVVNSDQVLYNRIKESGDSKAQLKKAAEELKAESADFKQLIEDNL